MEDRSISVLKRKATELGFRTEKLPSGALVFTDFLPALEGRGFPSRGFIVPTIGSGLHPSFGGQSSGSENHSHLALEYLPQDFLSSPLEEKEDNCCSSHSPIKPSVELGRSVVSVTKRCLEKEIFKYKGGYPSPP